MPRYGRAPKHVISPDSVYGSVTLQRFINKMMISGKKSKSEAIVYESLKLVSQKIKKEPMETFEKVLQNITPIMEVRPRRVGGATYQVPMEVPRERGVALAMQWIRENSRARKGRSMVEKLTQEMLDILQNTGPSIKKREDTHKMAEANKAFAHFRW